MSEEKRKDAIKRTGQLMLQGWRLLAQCCPICYTALLSSREGQMRCPFCDLPVVAEQPGVTYEEVPQNSAIPEVDEVDDEELDNFEADLPSSLEDLRKEYDSRNKSKASSTSALLGEKMLQGWTMLSENCPVTECRGTPLMRLGKAPAAMLCVACSRNYTLNANGDLVAEGSNTKVSSKIQDTVLQQTGFSLDDAPILNLNSFSNKNDSSQKISQKLMKGWALLDKCCMLPDCSGNIPLLRDKEEKLYCVQCGYQQPPNAKVETKIAAEKKRSYSLDEDDDEEETRKIAAKIGKITSDVLNNTREQQLSKSVDTHVVKASSTPVPFSSSANTSVTSKAIHVLKAKLEHTTSLLEGETNIEKLTQIAVCISKLADAIDSLNRLT